MIKGSSRVVLVFLTPWRSPFMMSSTKVDSVAQLNLFQYLQMSWNQNLGVWGSRKGDGLVPNLSLHLMFAASPNLSNRLKWNLGFKQMVGLEMQICQCYCIPDLLSGCAIPTLGFERGGGCHFLPLIIITFIHLFLAVAGKGRAAAPGQAAVPAWLAPFPNNPSIDYSVACIGRYTKGYAQWS